MPVRAPTDGARRLHYRLMLRGLPCYGLVMGGVKELTFRQETQLIETYDGLLSGEVDDEKRSRDFADIVKASGEFMALNNDI
eukprot:scaffold131_cov55-Attheya_sp.AAC.6